MPALEFGPVGGASGCMWRARIPGPPRYRSRMHGTGADGRRAPAARGAKPAFVRSRAGGLRIRHLPDLAPEHVVRAIEAHRTNAARGREFCEHWGPASSVSRILLRRDEGDLDLAVKWNHARGSRAAAAEWLRGSRAARAADGAEQLRGLGIAHPEAVALAELRRPGRL